jgi:peptide/nickel transport system substrate-binding protein
MMRSHRFLSAGLAAALLLLAGCTGKSGTAPPGPAPSQNSTSGNKAPSAKGKTVVFARPEDFSTGFDTANHFNLVNFGMEKHIYDTLVELTPDGSKIVPALADSWTTSADGKSWTFKLHSGVKFHNGEPFTSESVKVTLERFLTEKLAQGFLWDALDGVDTPDPQTAVIRLKRPFGPLISNLVTTSMIPPKAFKEQGAKLWEKPIGTGPFKFVEWVKGDRVVMEANKEYWRGAPKIDRIIYKPILDNSTALAAFQRGDVDVVDSVPPDLVAAFQQVPGAKIARGLAWDQIYLGIKTDKAPFDNVKVRQALNYVLDREGIVKNIMLGGRASSAMVPQGVLGFDDGVKNWPYDPAKAKQLLSEAGVKDLTIRLIAPQGWYPKINEITEAIRSNLADVGIKTDLQVLEGSAFIQARGAGNYDLYLTGGSSIAGDPDFLMVQRVVQDVFKSGFKDQQTLDLIQRARDTADRNERTTFYKQAQQRMNDLAAPFIWVFQMENVQAVSGRVENFTFMPNKIYDLRGVSLK